MGKRRKHRGGFLLPGSDNSLFYKFINQVVAPKVGQIGKSLQKRRRRQRGGYIPGLGFADFSTGLKRPGAALKKDEKFVGDLIKAYLLPQVMKRNRR